MKWKCYTKEVKNRRKEVNRMFNNDELILRIRRKFGSQQKFAEVIDISNVSLSLKLNNHVGITREEVAQWSELLEIPKEEIGSVFFTQ